MNLTNVFDLWEETRVPRINPRKHKQACSINFIKKGWEVNLQLSHCEVTSLTAAQLWAVTILLLTSEHGRMTTGSSVENNYV